MRRQPSCAQGYQLQKKEIPDDVTWIHSLPSPGDQSSIWRLTAQWDIHLKILVNHRIAKNSLNVLFHFSDLAPIEIYNNAYNPVGIYFEKTGHKHKRHKLYFTQQQRTDNNGLVFKRCIIHILQLETLQIQQDLEFQEFSPSGISVHFIPHSKDKLRTARKIRTVCNPT
jgi:hypothetical protein